MRMKNTQVLGTEAAIAARRRGRTPRYGIKAERLLLYVPPWLQQRLLREANFRNLRDEVSEWNASNVAVDILLDHFGMDKPGANGKSDD